jgi:ketosteroid isomerase-like protein
VGYPQGLVTQTSPAAETTLRDLDASIDALASSGDFDTLASRLAADFRYNHSTGLSQTKDEWLAGLRPLVGRRQRIVSAISVEVHGDLAVAMGDLDITWTDGRHNYDRYVRVYRRDEGNWVVVSQRTVPAHDRAPQP